MWIIFKSDMLGERVRRMLEVYEFVFCKEERNKDRERRVEEGFWGNAANGTFSYVLLPTPTEMIANYLPRVLYTERGNLSGNTSVNITITH